MPAPSGSPGAATMSTSMPRSASSVEQNGPGSCRERSSMRSDARAQVEFGINVAQKGLWREAIYRWEKATELDPGYAAAFNDLAIAYEHEGQLDKARKAYEKALELDSNNTQIRQNYELFKEINDRTSAGKDKP